MRNAIRQKLKSSSGASLLLALVFLLLSAVVSASVLMAAVSNAGRSRSKLEEHQKYLALSSALTLLSDDIRQAEYTGRYLYQETETPDGVGGTILSHQMEQQTGVYSGSLKPVLLADLDDLFGQTIESALAGAGYPVTVRSVTGMEHTEHTTEHTLELCPQTGTQLDEYPVQVQVKVRESYAIELTAELEGSVLRAELTPITTRPALPESLTPSGEVQSVPALKWKLGWITSGEEETT